MYKIEKVEDKFKLIFDNGFTALRNYTDLKMMYIEGKNKIREYKTIITELNNYNNSNFNLDLVNGNLLKNHNVLIINFDITEHDALLTDYNNRLNKVTTEFTEVKKHIRPEHLENNYYIEMLLG